MPAIDHPLKSLYDQASKVYVEHAAEIRRERMRYAFASYLRYIEQKNGYKIEIDFNPALSYGQATHCVTSDRVVEISLDCSLAHADQGILLDIVYGLIAHEIGHLILDHHATFARCLEYYKDLDKHPTDVAALHEVFEVEADLYGAILMIARGMVHERVFYDDQHEFLSSNSDAKAFKSAEFVKSKGFVWVRDNLLSSNTIQDPVARLDAVLNQVCNGKDFVLKVEATRDRARQIVQEYRRPLVAQGHD